MVCTKPLTPSQLAQNVDICPSLSLSLSKYILYFFYFKYRKKQDKLFKKKNPTDFHNTSQSAVTLRHGLALTFVAYYQDKSPFNLLYIYHSLVLVGNEKKGETLFKGALESS